MKNASKKNRIYGFLFPATTYVGDAMDEMVKDNPLAFFFLLFLFPWIFFALIIDVCYLAALVAIVGSAAWAVNYLLHMV